MGGPVRGGPQPVPVPQPVIREVVAPQPVPVARPVPVDIPGPVREVLVRQHLAYLRSLPYGEIETELITERVVPVAGYGGYGAPQFGGYGAPQFGGYGSAYGSAYPGF